MVADPGDIVLATIRIDPVVRAGGFFVAERIEIVDTHVHGSSAVDQGHINIIPVRPTISLLSQADLSSEALPGEKDNLGRLIFIRVLSLLYAELPIHQSDLHTAMDLELRKIEIILNRRWIFRIIKLDKLSLQILELIRVWVSPIGPVCL